MRRDSRLTTTNSVLAYEGLDDFDERPGLDRYIFVQEKLLFVLKQLCTIANLTVSKGCFWLLSKSTLEQCKSHGQISFQETSICKEEMKATSNGILKCHILATKGLWFLAWLGFAYNWLVSFLLCQGWQLFGNDLETRIAKHLEWQIGAHLSPLINCCR